MSSESVDVDFVVGHIIDSARDWGDTISRGNVRSLVEDSLETLEINPSESEMELIVSRVLNASYLERIDGGRNKVLVLHTKESDATFVIPPGVSEQEFLPQEAVRVKREAAALLDRAQQLTTRARHAEIAATLCGQASHVNRGDV